MKVLAYFLNILVGIIIGLSICLALLSKNIPVVESENYLAPTEIFSNSIPIITYHYIGYNPNPGKDPLREELITSPEEFSKQMEMLSTEGFTTITLDELSDLFQHKIPPPQKPIVLTFDDGYVDFYVNAYPLLRKFNFKATEFIPTGLIGKSNYLTWEMIDEMQKSGLVSFQSHTVNHPNLAYLPYSKVLAELTSSKKILEEKLGQPVNFLAYPYGASNFVVQQAAQKAGFKGALGTWSANSTEINFNMPRRRSLSH